MSDLDLDDLTVDTVDVQSTDALEHLDSGHTMTETAASCSCGLYSCSGVVED